jgi:hypothetical protein
VRVSTRIEITRENGGTFSAKIIPTPWSESDYWRQVLCRGLNWFKLGRHEANTRRTLLTLSTQRASNGPPSDAAR